MKKLLQFFVNTLEPAESYTHTHTHTHTHTGKPWLIKKQIGTICLILFSLFISPVFATEINNPATCDSGTLSTDTGPTNLRANYESNTLNLTWYDENNNQLTTNTCSYGGKIDLPTATPPTKPGYTFKGWKVVHYYDFSTLDADITGTSYTYNKTGMTWNVVFPYGEVSGIALCSVTAGVYAHTGTPDETTAGPYCWCKATEYRPDGDNIIYEPNSHIPWVFRNDSGGYNDAPDCLSKCASYCSYGVQSRASIRRAIFGQSGS